MLSLEIKFETSLQEKFFSSRVLYAKSHKQYKIFYEIDPLFCFYRDAWKSWQTSHNHIKSRTEIFIFIHFYKYLNNWTRNIRAFCCISRWYKRVLGIKLCIVNKFVKWDFFYINFYKVSRIYAHNSRSILEAKIL